MVNAELNWLNKQFNNLQEEAKGIKPLAFPITSKDENFDVFLGWLDLLKEQSLLIEDEKMLSYLLGGISSNDPFSSKVSSSDSISNLFSDNQSSVG